MGPLNRSYACFGVQGGQWFISEDRILPGIRRNAFRLLRKRSGILKWIPSSTIYRWNRKKLHPAPHHVKLDKDAEDIRLKIEVFNLPDLYAR